MHSRRLTLSAAALIAAAAVVTLRAQNAPVPKNLRPLLAKPASEMQLVVTRYDSDRQTLNANYAGAGGFNMPRGRGGRGGRGQSVEPAAPQQPPVPLSEARLARLKRFDLDWQAALSRVPAASLSPAGAADLSKLQASIAEDLAHLEAEHLELARIAPALPFAPKLVALVEARIRVKDVAPEDAARTLTEITGQLAATMAAPPARLNASTAARAALGADTLRAAMAEWFSFYDGYDPMFTWWMRMPYKPFDAALQNYAAFLRDKASDADVAGDAGIRRADRGGARAEIRIGSRSGRN